MKNQKIKLQHILTMYLFIEKPLFTSVSNSPDSTAMLMSVIIFTRSTNNPGRSAVSTYSKLQHEHQKQN